jgi:zinc transport system substrate-binding protein
VSVPIAGISPEEEPSPNRIADIVQTVRTTGANTVFFETLVSPALARTIAAETGIQVQVLNPIEGLTDNDVAKNNNYFSLMLDNLQVLRTALLCS